MKKFKDDYKLVPTIDDRGREKIKPVYQGEYFEVSLDEHGLLLFKRYCLMLIAVIAVLHISAGFLNNPGMYQFYIALPYVIIFLPLFYMAWGVLRIPKEKRQYRRDEVDPSFGQLKTSSKALLILFSIAAVGEIIYILFFSHQQNLMPEILFLSAEVFATLAIYLIIRLQQPVLVEAVSEQPSVE